MKIKLSYLPISKREKGPELLPYISRLRCNKFRLELSVLWWFLRWTHPLLSQIKTALGNTHSPCWGNGWYRRYSHRQVK